MDLCTNELDQGLYVMPDKKAARYFAHDLFEILYRMQKMEGLLECIFQTGASEARGLPWDMAQAANFAKSALEDINHSFLMLHEMFEDCNNLPAWHGPDWKKQIERQEVEA